MTRIINNYHRIFINTKTKALSNSKETKLFKRLVMSGIMVAVILLLSGCGARVAIGQYDDLAKSLTATGAKMYGSSHCGACNYQKELFGNSWQYINYIECTSSDGSGRQSTVCKDENIKAYPTWRFTGEDEEIGVMTIEQLKSKINSQN